MIATHNYDERIKRGKALEPIITQRLQSMGYKVETVSAKSDMIDKVDAIVNGVPTQYKVRETGPDILFDAFEPFVAPNSKENKIGRDLAGKSQQTVVLLKNERVFIVSKRSLVAVIKAVHVEWEAAGCSQKFSSTVHKGVQVNWTSDHSNGRRKLLFFVPPSVIQDAKEVY